MLGADDEVAILVSWPDGAIECRATGSIVLKNKRIKRSIQDGADVLIFDACFAIKTDEEITVRPYSEISELSFGAYLAYYECNP